MEKLLKSILFAVVLVLIFSSCSTRMPYENPGLVGNVVDKDYEILGPVSVSGKYHNVLGFIGWGGIGYNDIIEKARDLYPDTDAVINLTQDTKSFNVFIFYNCFEVDMSGLAIKYIDNIGDHSVNVNLDISE